MLRTRVRSLRILEKSLIMMMMLDHGTMLVMFLPLLAIPVVLFFYRRLFSAMCLSGPPRDAIALSPEEEAAWVESLQGDWDIEAVDLESIAQTNSRIVKPIGFKTAKVTGKNYVMGGGPRGSSRMQTFDFRKSPATGQVYLDRWGSIPMTPGWPRTRPMRGQAGEVFDVKTVFASIRWTRRTPSAAATGFGQVQQAADASCDPRPALPDGQVSLAVDAAPTSQAIRPAFCPECGASLQAVGKFCSSCGFRVE